MPRTGTWGGDVESAQRLQHVIERNCSCEINTAGQRNGKCPAHQALLDQRFLDGLLWAQWLRERLVLEEQR